jgi:energy-coupling factor transporter ATP-binding protein EcfA2
MPIPATRSLSELLPNGAEGGNQFARVVDLLIFHDTRRRGGTALLLNDKAGDYEGLDSLATVDSIRTGFQYKYFKSPLSSAHRSEIAKSLESSFSGKEKSEIAKWIIVTPDDLVEAPKRRDGGDVRWFDTLRVQYRDRLEIEHWGHTKLQALFIETPSVALFYYPELVAHGGPRVKTLRETQELYVANMLTAYGKIQFVGMSVYKPEATKGIEMQHIYIPLTLIRENANDDTYAERMNPAALLAPRSLAVILGDPGSGKSTLLKFLALASKSPNLQAKFKLREDRNRLPILVTLRRYADELKTRPQLPLIDYMVEVANADFNLRAADIQFFEAFLDSGQAVLCFDGLDELPNSAFKEKIRDRISSLLHTFPGNTCLVTSRIVGYESTFRFDDGNFAHWRIARLQVPEIEQFVTEWYAVREESPKERDDNVTALVRVIRDPEHEAIRELAGNPLLLTIIALVHRIDAVLPDERVVLYQKCTETLLNTWHTWKFRDSEDQASRTKAERRNKRRIETIAHWMQLRSVGRQQRAIVSYVDLKMFVTAHVQDNERLVDGDTDAEHLADEFLEFVRKRAGLLIEVGDGQYSFVHLTFQEYLAAADIRTISEKGGALALWKNIRDTTDADRWQETTRLLIASLQSPDTRAYLVDQLIRQGERSVTVNRCLLLMGCLIDGIEEAEDRLLDILRLTLLAAVRSSEGDDLKRVTARARKVSLRRSIGEYARAAAIAAKESVGFAEATTLPLALVAMGASDDCVLKEYFQESDQREQASWYDILLRSQPEPANVAGHQDAQYPRALLETSSALASFNPSANALAVALSRVAFGLSLSGGFDFCARLVMTILLKEVANARSGPYEDVGLNVIAVINFILRRDFLPTSALRRGMHLNEPFVRILRQLRVDLDPALDGKMPMAGSLREYSNAFEITSLFRMTNLNEIGTAFSDQTARLLASVLGLKPQILWAEAMSTRWQDGAGLANWDVLRNGDIEAFLLDPSFRTLILVLHTWQLALNVELQKHLSFDGIVNDVTNRLSETDMEAFAFALHECVLSLGVGREPRKARERLRTIRLQL